MSNICIAIDDQTSRNELTPNVYTAQIKTKLAQLIAFKQSFAQLSSWESTIGISAVSFCSAASFFELLLCAAKNLSDLKRQARYDYAKIADWEFLAAIGVRGIFYSLLIGTIPWISAGVHKWLDIMCQSYEAELLAMKENHLD